jgi:hypothetical protein
MWSSVAAGVVVNAAVCGAFMTPSAPFSLASRRPAYSARSPLRMVASPPMVPPGDSAAPSPDPEDPQWKGTTHLDRQLVRPRKSRCAHVNCRHSGCLVATMLCMAHRCSIVAMVVTYYVCIQAYWKILATAHIHGELYLKPKITDSDVDALHATI